MTITVPWAGPCRNRDHHGTLILISGVRTLPWARSGYVTTLSMSYANLRYQDALDWRKKDAPSFWQRSFDRAVMLAQW